METTTIIYILYVVLCIASIFVTVHYLKKAYILHPDNFEEFEGSKEQQLARYLGWPLLYTFYFITYCYFDSQGRKVGIWCLIAVIIPAIIYTILHYKYKKSVKQTEKELRKKRYQEKLDNGDITLLKIKGKDNETEE